MKQCADIVGVNRVVHSQQAELATRFPLDKGAIGVTNVIDLDIGKEWLITKLWEIGQQLLVHTAVPAKIGVPAEETGMRNGFELARWLGGRQHRLHEVCPNTAIDLFETAPQERNLLGADTIVSVKPKNPVARGVFEAFVASCGKVVTPRKVIHMRCKASGNLFSTIGRPGIDNDNFVKQVDDWREAGLEVALLVTDDHAQSDADALSNHGISPG